MTFTTATTGRNTGASAVSTSAHVAIIGGGIAGLAAAFRLTQIAPAARIMVIEREPRLGGKIVTHQIDGFTIEGGPDSMLAVKPRGIGLCRDMGIEHDLQGVRQETRRTFVLRDGRLYDLPEGLTGLVPTRLGPMLETRLISPAGKARMALDYVLPARTGDGDETLAAFIERRLGREVYERLVEPLMAGIYAGDGRHLSLAATFPQLRAAEREHGGLIKGVLATRRASGAQSPAPRSPFITPRGGLGDLITALDRCLRAAGVDIRTGTPVAALYHDLSSGRYRIALGDGTSLESRAVIVATPARAAGYLLDEIAPDAAQALRSIPAVSTATVALGFNEADLRAPLPGHGYVIPRVENRPALACTVVSSKWAHRAPVGKVLLRVFVGRAHREDVVDGRDEDLIAVAREELATTLGIAATPVLTHVTRWPEGMPQYTLGHLDRVAAIERAVADVPGLRVAGAAYRGVGIPDCIASGERAAGEIAAALALAGAGQSIS